MNITTFFVLTTSIFIAMLSHGLVMPLLPIYANTLGASNVELGFIAAGSSFASLTLMPFIGAWSDKYGRKIFITVSLALMTSAVFLMSRAENALDLIALRCMQGVATSMLFPVAQALLGDMIPHGQEGRWMGYFNGAVWGGLGLGPLFGGSINDLLNMQAVFYITASMMFISFLISLFFLRVEPSKKSTGPRPSLLRGFKNKTLIGISLLQIGMGLTMGASLVFLPLLGHVELALSTTLVGIILAIRTPISMLQGWVGKMADRFGPFRLVMIGGLINAAAFFLLPWSIGFWSLLMLHALLALGTTIVQPAASIFLIKEGRHVGMGIAMSISMMATQVGMGIGPILMGNIVERTTLTGGFTSIAVLSLIATVAFILQLYKSHGKQSVKQ